MTDPIPAGATYVPGSVAVNGPGTGSGNGTAVTWDGVLAPGGQVTVSYRITLTALGGVVLNAATISAPLMIAPQVITAAVHVQPYYGPGIGHDRSYFFRDSYA